MLIIQKLCQQDIADSGAVSVSFSAHQEKVNQIRLKRTNKELSPRIPEEDFHFLHEASVVAKLECSSAVGNLS